jgi:hypothetical protein
MPSPTTSNPIVSSPSRKRRDARVAVVLAPTLLASSFLLGALALSIVPTTACLCDCGGAFNYVSVVTDASAPIAGLSITGNACGEATCVDPAQSPDGACLDFKVKLTQVGTCHVEATASDGRQASVDVNVQQTGTTCCGPMYAANGPNLQFSPPDAGGQ